MNQLLSVKEVKEILQVGDSTLRRLVSSKKLKSYRVGGQLRFDPEDLKEFLKQCSN